MRSTAFAFEDEYDEVLVNSTEVLEANIAAVRESLNDFKTEVRAEFTHVKGEIKSVREDLTREIKSVREDLTDEIKSVREDLTREIKSAREDLTGEVKSLREKSDKAFERLFTKFDAEIKETNKALSELTKTVLRIDSRQSAVLWVCGGLGALITLLISVGKAFSWI